MKSFKTETEQQVGKAVERVFVNCVVHRDKAYIFQIREATAPEALPGDVRDFQDDFAVQGVDRGVRRFRGFSVMAWAKPSTIRSPRT